MNFKALGLSTVLVWSTIPPVLSNGVNDVVTCIKPTVGILMNHDTCPGNKAPGYIPGETFSTLPNEESTPVIRDYSLWLDWNNWNRIISWWTIELNVNWNNRNFTIDEVIFE